MEANKAWLVSLRIVKRHHDHRGIKVVIPWSQEDHPHLSAATPEAAEAAARDRVASAAQVTREVGEDGPRAIPGYVKLESVELVEVVPLGVRHPLPDALAA